MTFDFPQSCIGKDKWNIIKHKHGIAIISSAGNTFFKSLQVTNNKDGFTIL